MYRLQGRTWVWSASRAVQTEALSSTRGTVPSEQRSEARTAHPRYLHGVRLDAPLIRCGVLPVDAISRLLLSLQPELYTVRTRSSEVTLSSGCVRVVVISALLRKIGSAHRDS